MAGRVRRGAKRIVDVLLAATLLVVTAPFVGLAAIAVRLTMGSPVLWKHVRPGKDGVPFVMYKLRSMRMPEQGENWLRTDADRLTPVGRFLRMSSIDELPELWNVLKGDMSLVGPRPLLMEYLPRYTDEQQRRHQVRPGITGWAQVNGRQSIPFSERLHLDVWYVEHQSLSLDIRILGRTIRQAVSGRGVISGQEVDCVDDLSPAPAKDRSNAHHPR